MCFHTYNFLITFLFEEQNVLKTYSCCIHSYKIDCDYLRESINAIREYILQKLNHLIQQKRNRTLDGKFYNQEK